MPRVPGAAGGSSPAAGAPRRPPLRGGALQRQPRHTHQRHAPQIRRALRVGTQDGRVSSLALWARSRVRFSFETGCERLPIGPELVIFLKS